jgi:AraC-like DNA-binding protein
MRFTFSTAALEPGTRFEAFRDCLVRRLFQVELQNLTDGPYRGAVDLHVGGPVEFGRVVGSSAQFTRGARFGQQVDDGVSVLLTRRGQVLIAQDDTEFALGPGDGIIFDAVRGHSGRCVGDTETFVVQVPGVLLHALQVGSQHNRTLILPASTELAGLMAGVLEAHSAAGAVPTAASFSTGQYLGDLVAIALGVGSDGAELAKGRGLKGARLQAVEAQIAQHFLEPGFGVADVAQSLGVSTRYVHMILEETGLSFSGHLLERRLDFARHILADPSQCNRRVADIAYGSGFSDLSYFNRRYRQRYGESPTETRWG